MTSRCRRCNRELVSVSSQGDAATRNSDDFACAYCGDATMNSAILDLTERATTEHYESTVAPQRIAHFELTRILGSGGFGDVWLARDSRLNRMVALKLSKSRRRESSSLVFEAQTAASLRHPHIVSVHEVGEEHGQIYIASDLIEGMTLADLLSAGKPMLGRTIEILIPIAQALHFAHSRGVIHRDVKPANILIDHGGQPYVTDFGLAKRASDTSSSGEGKMVGTVRYMSPEQAIGNFGETDGRSDVYALGVTMFEMLTGETPFRGNAQAMLHQKAFDDPPSPRQLDPLLPRDLETICLKCLEREPAKRFRSARELAEELSRYAADEPIHSRPISQVERAWRWCQKRPAISGLVAGLILSLTLGLIGVSYFWSSSASLEAATRSSLYRSWMNMAAIHLQTGDTEGVRRLLARVENEPRLYRNRSFEWDYFKEVLKPISSIGNMGNVITDVALTHNGDYVAAACDSEEVMVWNAKSNELVRMLSVTKTKIEAIDFSPASTQLASGASDGFVRLFEPLTDDRMVREFRHGPAIVHLVYSPTGNQLVSAGKMGAVRVWNPAAGALIAELPIRNRISPTIAVQYSPDGRLLFVAAEDGHLRVWDMTRLGASPPAAVPVPELELDLVNPLTALAVSVDGKRIHCGTYNGEVDMFSIDGTRLSTLQSHWGRIDDMVSVPASNRVAIATNDGQLHLYDPVARNDVRALHTHGLAAARLKPSASGKALAIGGGDGAVSVIDLDAVSSPAILWHPEQQPVRCVKFIGGAGKLLASYINGEFWLWDSNTGVSRPLVTSSRGDERAIAVHPNMKTFATGSKLAIEVWDADSWQMKHELVGPSSGVTSVEYSADGELLAVAMRAGTVRVYRNEIWTKPQIEIGDKAVGQTLLAFSSDDSLLAIARADGRILVVNPRTGASRGSTTLSTQPSAIAFTGKRDELAIGTGAGEIHFWDVGSENVSDTIKGHTGRIHSLVKMRASPNLISAGRDRLIKFWDISSRELNAPLAGHFRQVFSVAISPDEATIASGSLEGDIRIWRAKPL